MTSIDISIIGSPGSGKSTWMYSLLYHLLYFNTGNIIYENAYRRTENMPPLTNWELKEKISMKYFSPDGERTLRTNIEIKNFVEKGELPKRTPPTVAYEFNVTLSCNCQDSDNKDEINLSLYDISGELMRTFLLNVDDFNWNNIYPDYEEFLNILNGANPDTVYQNNPKLLKVLYEHITSFINHLNSKYCILFFDQSLLKDDKLGAYCQNLLMKNFRFFLKQQKSSIEKNVVIIIPKGDIVPNFRIGLEYIPVSKSIGDLLKDLWDSDYNFDPRKDIMLCSSTGAMPIQKNEYEYELESKYLPPKAWDVIVPIARMIMKIKSNNEIKYGASDDPKILEIIG